MKKFFKWINQFEAGDGLLTYTTFISLIGTMLSLGAMLISYVLKISTMDWVTAWWMFGVGGFLVIYSLNRNYKIYKLEENNANLYERLPDTVVDTANKVNDILKEDRREASKKKLLLYIEDLFNKFPDISFVEVNSKLQNNTVFIRVYNNMIYNSLEFHQFRADAWGDWYNFEFKDFDVCIISLDSRIGKLNNSKIITREYIKEKLKKYNL